MTGNLERRSRLVRLAPALTVMGILAATVAVAAMAATMRVATAPSNTAPPTVSGDVSVGSTLKVDNGTWSGTQPLSFAYQWRRCDANGGSCSDISGATQQSYALKSVDKGNTLRVRVTASNSDGKSAATTVPTAVVKEASQPAPPTGCPKTAQGATVNVSDLSAPARLEVDQFQAIPGVIPGNMTSFTVRFHVSDTCGQTVSGAQVFATAVPYNQVNVPAEAPTGPDGWVTLHFNRLTGFPATPKQELMVMFVRARKPGQNPLAGITTRRLVSFRVNLH